MNNMGQDMCKSRLDHDLVIISILSFSRFIGVVNPGFDLNLNDGEYFFLFGQGPTGGGNGSFPHHHRPSPTISNARVNPVTSVGRVGVDAVSANLIRAHGILMIIAYPVLVRTAVFVATWMKPALPNAWFQIHRAFMISALFIAALGFVLIFVAFRDNVIPGLINLGTKKIATAHFAIAIVVMAYHTLNLIVPYFRCKPDSKARGLYVLVHGTLIGQVVQILGVVNVGIGLFLFSFSYSRFGDLTILSALLVRLVLACIATPSEPVAAVMVNCSLVVPSLVTTIPWPVAPGPCGVWLFAVQSSACAISLIDVKESKLSKEKPVINEDKVIKGDGGNKETSAKDLITTPQDLRRRWIAFGLLLVVMLPFVFVTIVLVALPLQ